MAVARFDVSDFSTLNPARTLWRCAVLVGLALLSANVLAKADVPQGLWQAFIEARHAFEGDGGRVRAHNPGNRHRIRLDEARLEVTSSQRHPGQTPAWRWGLSLSGYGTPEQLSPVATAAPQIDGNRVRYARGPLTEWYHNRRIGLEQGFTLRTPPAHWQPGRGEPLVLQLKVHGGLSAQWEQPGQALAFYTPEGEYALSYRKLHVIDADGVEQPAWLALAGDDLQIKFEADQAAWPILVDPLVVNGEQKVIADDGAAGDSFGRAVALDGDTALIAAPWDDDAGGSSGSAYVFARSGTSWGQQAKLTASDGAAGDYFGYSVALDGETALIGAHGDNDAGSDSGSAYVFTRSGTSWSQQAKLTAGDGATGDFFGYSVALDGETALIGAYGDDDAGGSFGSAYVFTRSGTSWSQQAKLTAGDGAADDRFGYSVALDGDTALIGAPREDANGSESGSAYVFRRTPVFNGTLWYQQDKLTADDGSPDDQFGYAVALSGNTALIGAWQDYANDRGSAYVFTRSGERWSQQAKLIADDGAENENYRFGVSVALDGDAALVGATSPGVIVNNFDPNSTYVFVNSGEGWTQQVKLAPSDGATGDFFGASVALSGDMALIGAYGNEDAGSRSGSAYFYDLGDCEMAAVNIAQQFSAGSYSRSSGESITVTETAALGAGASLSLRAPTIRFEPGVRIASGAQLSAVAEQVQCPAAAAVAEAPAPTERRKAAGSTAALSAPRLSRTAAALPDWVQAQLEGLGVSLESITSNLLDADERWLILETNQALVDLDANGASDLYRVDLLSDQIDLVSITPCGRAGNAPSRYPAVDASGELIVFQSDASDLVLGDENAVSDIFVRDLALEHTTRLSQGEQASANPALDAAGDTLLYDQTRREGSRQVLGQALTTVSAAEVLSLQTDDAGTLVDTHHPAISADGRFVAYLEEQTSVEAPACQVHIFDRETAIYHRQPCPDALAGATELARPIFRQDGEVLLWSLPDLSEPVRMPNVLKAAEDL